jgi:hypothetical protein
MMRLFLMKVIFTIIAVILLIWVTACDKGDKSKTLVTLGNTSISASEIKGSVSDGVWPQMSESEKDALLQSAIRSELMSIVAEKKKLDKHPKVRAELEKVRRELLDNNYTEMIIEPTIEITDNEIQKYYKENENLFLWPEDAFHLRKLVFDNETFADSAEGIIDDVGDIFIAGRQFGIDSTSIDVGFIPSSEILPSILNKIDSRDRGDIVGPFEFENGYVIIEVTDIAKGGILRPLNDVRDEIENMIFTERREELRRQVVDSLFQFYKPVVDSALWDSLKAVNYE